MAKAAHGIPPDKLAAYEALVATNPKVARKGDKVPYTSVNGHMFTYLDQTGTLGMRLPEDVREKFLKKYKTKLFESYGVVKKDWVTVPEKLLAKTKELAKYLVISHESTKSLKPK